MFLHQLVHLPVLLACSSSQALRSMDRIPDAQLHGYWLASRTLMFRWCCQLRALKESLHETRGIERERAWNNSKFVLREALIHELTTRLFSAVLEGMDELSSSDEHCSVAQSVFCGQLDVRHRILNLLISAEGLHLPDLHHLNHDRRNLEGWSDRLLRLLPAECPKRAYFSHPTVEAPGDELGSSLESFNMLSMALASSMPAVRFQKTRNGPLHLRVSDAVLSCLGPALFAGGVQPVGPFRSSLDRPEVDRKVDIGQWLPRGDQTPESGAFGALERF